MLRNLGLPADSGRHLWQIMLLDEVVKLSERVFSVRMPRSIGRLIYRRAADFQTENDFRPPLDEIRKWREVTRRATMACWVSRLETPCVNFAIVEALQPVILE